MVSFLCRKAIFDLDLAYGKVFQPFPRFPSYDILSIYSGYDSNIFVPLDRERERERKGLTCEASC